MASITVVRIENGRKVTDTTFDPVNIPTSDQKAGLDNAPSMAAANPVALQSDIAVITAGTTINASTATLVPWKSATKDSFTDADEVTIEKTANIESVTKKGSPIRFSSDGTTWKYGLIKALTVNASTIDLTIKGIAMTDPLTAFIEIGSPDMVKSMVLDINGTLSTGEAVDGIMNTERLWPFAPGFIVETLFKPRTAAVGDNLQGAVALNNVTNKVTQSVINMGTSNSRVSSDVDIDESNYQVDHEDNVLVDITNVGSTTPGSDLTVTIVGVIDIFEVEQFVPQGAETPPFGFQFTGSTNTTSHTTGSNAQNDIGYFDFATSTGDALNRGVDVENRTHSSSVFDDVRSFNVNGIAGTTNSDTISFIDTPSTTVDAVNRGVDTLVRNQASGVSGQTHGHIMGGKSGTPTQSQITSLLLPTATGDAFNRGQLPQINRQHGSAFGNQQGVTLGGGSAGSPGNSIFQLGIQNPVGGAADRGNAVESSLEATGIGEKATETAFFLGGTANSANFANPSDTIQSFDLTLGTGDANNRDTLPAAKAGATGNSGETIGYNSGGFVHNAISNSIEKFTYTTGTIVVSNRGLVFMNVHEMGSSM